MRIDIQRMRFLAVALVALTLVADCNRGATSQTPPRPELLNELLLEAARAGRVDIVALI